MKTKTTPKSKLFIDSKEAQSFEIDLRKRGIECRVRENPAIPAEIQMRPNSAAAEKILANGDETARAALKWALESYWAKDNNELSSIIGYLEADLHEGESNGEGARAAILMDRLLSALFSTPQVECVVAPARPASFEIHWDEPVAPDAVLMHYHRTQNMKTPEQLALFDNIQTRQATEEETKALSGLTFYSVSLHQFANITHLASFLSEKDANEFIMSHWRQNKSHPDFAGKGEDRARLVASEHVFDEDGIEDSWAICVFE